MTSGLVARLTQSSLKTGIFRPLAISAHTSESGTHNAEAGVPPAACQSPTAWPASTTLISGQTGLPALVLTDALPKRKAASDNHGLAALLAVTVIVTALAGGPFGSPTRPHPTPSAATTAASAIRVSPVGICMLSPTFHVSIPVPVPIPVSVNVHVSVHVYVHIPVHVYVHVSVNVHVDVNVNVNGNVNGNTIYRPTVMSVIST